MSKATAIVVTGPRQIGKPSVDRLAVIGSSIIRFTVCAHLFLREWNVSPRLSYPRTHWYNTRQFTAAVAAMPSVVQLLVLGEGIIGKV